MHTAKGYAAILGTLRGNHRLVEARSCALEDSRGRQGRTWAEPADGGGGGGGLYPEGHNELVRQALSLLHHKDQNIMACEPSSRGTYDANCKHPRHTPPKYFRYQKNRHTPVGRQEYYHHRGENSRGFGNPECCAPKFKNSKNSIGRFLFFVFQI